MHEDLTRELGELRYNAKRMSEFARIDDSSFPLVVVTYPEHPRERTLDDYFERMRPIVQRGRFALVADIRPVSMLDVDIEMRRSFFKRVREWDSGPGAGKKISEAIVIESWFARALVAAYVWQVQPQGFDLRVMASFQEACSWSLANIAKEQVREAG